MAVIFNIISMTYSYLDLDILESKLKKAKYEAAFWKRGIDDYGFDYNFYIADLEKQLRDIKLQILLEN